MAAENRASEAAVATAGLSKVGAFEFMFKFSKLLVQLTPIKKAKLKDVIFMYLFIVLNIFMNDKF